MTSKYDWKNIKKEPDSGSLELIKKEKLIELASQILCSRGADAAEKLTQLLSTDLPRLHDLYFLHDMDKTVERIRQATENYEQILVYGDYDVNGITSASIMKEAFEILGAEVQVYLSNRFTDGYGLNELVYKYFIEQQNVSLIITVDNGVAGHEATVYAQSQGVDVIVTGHRGSSAELPKAFAIVYPEHPEADYPFKYLADCGVAFKVTCTSLEPILTEMFDLVAIGTIADTVSLTDESRTMAKVGLEILKQTERTGLIELMKVSDADIGDVNEEAVGFKTALQLNTLGRLDDLNPVVELLTGFDNEEAHNIVKVVNTKNGERKEIIQKIFEEAMSMADLEKPVQVLVKEGWRPGVSGTVTGRILEQIAQPVIVLNIENGLVKGSAGSIEAINIFHVFDEHRGLFEAFGGHVGAAGMTLATENLDKLSQVLYDYIAENGIDLSQKKELAIDEVLELSKVNPGIVYGLEKLAPSGIDNPKPVFEIKDFVVKQIRTTGQNGVHLKLKIAQGAAAIDLVAFN